MFVLLYYNGRTDRASLQPLLVFLYYNGRTDRASLHRATRLVLLYLGAGEGA